MNPKMGCPSFHLSPGKAMLAMILDHGCRSGWARIDYGPGMEDYKQQWSNQQSPVYRWQWTGDSWRQRVLCGVRRLREPQRSQPV